MHLVGTFNIPAKLQGGMNVKKLLMVFGLSLSLALAGCGVGKLSDIDAKTKDVKTKEELVKALGEPTRRSSTDVGIVSGDIYEYDASDGTATFTIVNGKIMAKNRQSKKK